MCTVSTLQPGYSIVPSNSMPAVVSSEQAVVSARMDDSEGHQLLQMPAADGSDNENIIQKQQKQIEDLTRALERSRQQLIETQNQQQTSGKVEIIQDEIFILVQAHSESFSNPSPPGFHCKKTFLSTSNFHLNTCLSGTLVVFYRFSRED